MSFNSTLMNNVIDTYKILCNQLLKTSRVLDDDKKMLLDSLPCFNKLRNEIVFPCLDSTTDLVLATIGRDQKTIPDLVVAPVKTDGELTDLNNLGNVKTQDREGEMHLNPVSRCCAMTTMMQSLTLNFSLCAPKVYGERVSTGDANLAEGLCESKVDDGLRGEASRAMLPFSWNMNSAEDGDTFTLFHPFFGCLSSGKQQLSHFAACFLDSIKRVDREES
eukprot:s2470_g1.t1